MVYGDRSPVCCSPETVPNTYPSTAGHLLRTPPVHQAVESGVKDEKGQLVTTQEDDDDVAVGADPGECVADGVPYIEAYLPKQIGLVIVRKDITERKMWSPDDNAAMKEVAYF